MPSIGSLGSARLCELASWGVGCHILDQTQPERVAAGQVVQKVAHAVSPCQVTCLPHVRGLQVRVVRLLASEAVPDYAATFEGGG